MVEEEGVVERRPASRGELQVFRLRVSAVQDQVGQDRLLLLPPGLAVVPGEAVPVLAGACEPAPSRRTSRRAGGSLPTLGISSLWKGALLWLLGIPLPIIILLALFMHH